MLTEGCVRCPECGARHFIFTGASDFGRAAERAREKAEKTGAVFIDARKTPLMNCRCGYPLDFTTGDMTEKMMADRSP